MRSRAHIQGHPIHPMLIPFPFAYLFGAACIDTVAYAADKPRWYPTARHMRVLGLGAAVAAAVPGLIDYFLAVPPDSSAARRATYHGAANLSAVAVLSAVAAGRRDDDQPRPWELTAQLGAAGLMAFAGWLGGTLVYRNQIGVDHRYADAGKWQEKALPADVSSPDVSSSEASTSVHPTTSRSIRWRCFISAIVASCSHGPRTALWPSTIAARTKEDRFRMARSPAERCSVRGTVRSST